jgi:lysylphosphatidylglycerol synthetase-like protein (DUF2156 family)
MPIAQIPTCDVGARTGEDDAAKLVGILRRHAEHSSAFLALNEQTLHFTTAGIDGFVAYRPSGRRHLIQLCGPFTAAEHRAPLARSFLDWVHAQGRRVTAVQLTRADAAEYVEHGFVANQLGSSYSIDLESFTIRGTKFFKLRNKLKRATRLGVTVHELAPEEMRRESTLCDLASIDAPWLRAKGRHVRELTFMIGERGGRGAPYRRVFLARHEGRPTAYVTYSPCFGSRSGWLYDLTRRRPDAPPGTVELIFATAIDKLREEQCRWLHLGLTPLVGLDQEHELPLGSSPGVRRLVHLIGDRGTAIYPAHAQEKFKLKWAPHLIEPEYVAFEPRPSLAAVWQLMRVTRAI